MSIKVQESEKLNTIEVRKSTHEDTVHIQSTLKTQPTKTIVNPTITPLQILFSSTNI